MKYNATKQNPSSQVLLYQADGFGPGKHTLKLVNQPVTAGQTLSIDFASIMCDRNHLITNSRTD